MLSHPVFARRIIAALLTVAVAAVALLALTAGAAGATAAPPCTTSSLDVWLAGGAGGGTAGGTYYDLQFTNLSGRACTLYGYPGLSAVDLSGRRLGAAARRDVAHASSTVTLAAATPQDLLGATATAVIKITDDGVYGPSRCEPIAAAGLRVYPPGQTASRVVPFPFTACSRSVVSILSVEAVERGQPSQ